MKKNSLHLLTIIFLIAGIASCKKQIRDLLCFKPKVQHSTDGVAFTTTGIVPASGNSNTEKHYSYNSNLISQNNYFRLRMVDVAGSSKFSAVVSVNSNCGSNVIIVFPNPAKNMITVMGLAAQTS